MDVFYKPPFRRFVKKQSRPFQLIIEDEVDKIVDHIETGEAKKGDLSGFRVHRFHFTRQMYMIAYRSTEMETVFFMIGPHENFYRELKRYLRETKE
ncbi:MAG: type II toxin-antitoxin system RelE/ParE family toxin [Deltaproteobacteria bacterium]|nr:type II toxin-antitoxin system RelE/ParE family toxin [Deltaproteobacteria bacterium]